jgi:hypothetical protein
MNGAGVVDTTHSSLSAREQAGVRIASANQTYTVTFVDGYGCGHDPILLACQGNVKCFRMNAEGIG